MNRQSPVPYRPDYAAARTRTSQPIFRSAAAALIGKINNRRVEEIYPNDEATALMTRAAVTSATTTTPGWAAEIVGVGVTDFVSVLAPASAGATAMMRGLQFTYPGGYAALQVPAFTAAKTDASFVSQGSNIPVHKFDFSKFVLLPVRKLAAISVFTREMFQHSIPNIETAVRATILESLGLTLDSIMFDATGADATRPAGLLAGINATVASAASTALEAMKADVGALVTAVAPVAGSSPILLIAAPAQSAALRLWRTGGEAAYEVLPSGALTAGTVIAIASNCLVSAADPAPRFHVTNEASIVMDSAPTDIVTGGTPFSDGGAVKSLFQVDAIGLRTILQVNWGLRSPTGLAWTQSVLW